MAKVEDPRGRGFRPLPHSEFQRSAYEAVGDDLPKDPTVVDESELSPGDKKRNQAKSRSSKGGEK